MKNLKLSREKVLKLMATIRNFVNTEMEISAYLDESFFKNDEQTEIDIYFQGVSNGFLAEIFHAITGYEVEVIGEVEKLFPCPCCGFKTLVDLHDIATGTGYDICPYCKWEDDGTNDVNLYKSINSGSIEDYRDKICADFNQYYIHKWFKD